MHFNIDQYTDATLVVKPKIYISVNDIINTHSKLLEYKAKISPDTTDVIHELLDDLGENAPTITELLGGKTLLYSHTIKHQICESSSIGRVYLLLIIFVITILNLKLSSLG